MYAGKNSVLSLYTGWRGLVVSVSLWNSVIRIVERRIVTDVGGSGRGLTLYTTLAFAWRFWTKSRTSVSVICLQAEVWTWDLLNTKHELSTLPWSLLLLLLLLLLFIPRTSISAGTLWLLPCSKPSALWVRSHNQGLPGGKGRHSCTLATCPYLQGDFKVNTWYHVVIICQSIRFMQSLRQHGIPSSRNSSLILSGHRWQPVSRLVDWASGRNKVACLKYYCYSLWFVFVVLMAV